MNDTLLSQIEAAQQQPRKIEKYVVFTMATNIGWDEATQQVIVTQSQRVYLAGEVMPIESTGPA